MNPLNERLREWQDFDVAAYDLGVVLGLFADTPEGGWWLDHAPKWVFWSDNPLGNALHELLQQLVTIRVLESNEHGQYRWNGEVAQSLLRPKE
jgi:hypothetical protein